MGNMYDAVDPGNLPAQLDGQQALHITVQANPGSECFDIEQGNASGFSVGGSIKARYDRGLWSIAYISEDFLSTLRALVENNQLPLLPADSWPAPGCYLWAATGGATPGTIPPWCPVTPIAVQDRYQGVYDVSTTFGRFPAAVAGYDDGPVSVWPAAAWNRFTPISATEPAPTPQPVPPPAPVPPFKLRRDTPMILVVLTDDGPYGNKNDQRAVEVGKVVEVVDNLVAQLGEPMPVANAQLGLFLAPRTSV